MTDETLEQRLKRVWARFKPDWKTLNRMRIGEHWFVNDTPLQTYKPDEIVSANMVMEVCQFKLTYIGNARYALFGCMRGADDWHNLKNYY